jgi:hypothetical protein
MTPDQFWDLDMPTYRAMVKVLQELKKAQSPQQARDTTTLAAMAARHGQGG